MIAPPAPLPARGGAVAWLGRQGRSARRTWWARRGVIVAAAVLITVMAFALVGPWVSGGSPERTVGRPFAPPGNGHLLGLDHLGRDVWVNLAHSGRTLVVLPLVATVLTGAVGIAVGLSLGWTAGAVARFAGRVLDLGLVVPPFLVLLVLLHGWDASPASLVVAVAVSGVPFVARLAQVSTARERASGHAELALAAGESTVGVLWREILPSVLVTVAADAGLRYVGSVYLLATVGFLGFDSGDSWAAMVGANVEGARLNAWALTAPAAAIATLTIPVSILADHAARHVTR